MLRTSWEPTAQFNRAARRCCLAVDVCKRRWIPSATDMITSSVATWRSRHLFCLALATTPAPFAATPPAAVVVVLFVARSLVSVLALASSLSSVCLQAPPRWCP